jgi:hypothetical protein
MSEALPMEDKDKERYETTDLDAFIMGLVPGGFLRMLWKWEKNNVYEEYKVFCRPVDYTMYTAVEIMRVGLYYSLYENLARLFS